MRKIVVSSQQLAFAWRNSELLRGDLVEAVTVLKNEPGANVGTGEVDVPSRAGRCVHLDDLLRVVVSEWASARDAAVACAPRDGATRQNAQLPGSGASIRTPLPTGTST